MSQEPPQTLYRHSKRPQWGLAILAGETPSKKRYLFQDGQTRVFPANFAHLMEPVDKPLDVAARVATELTAQLGGSTAPKASKVADRVSFAEQLAIFEHLFPGGFQDPDYIAKIRTGPRRRKRHRDPLIADAQAALSKENLEAAIAAGEGTQVHEITLKLLEACTSVSKRHRQPLESLPPERHADLATALYDLLYGEDSEFDRFTRYVHALDHDPGDRPTWAMTTAIPSMVQPNHHVAVKRSVFAKQAAWMAPRLVVGDVPNGGQYQRILTMAAGISTRLQEAGHPPRDMWDVHDFVWTTLRPKHLALLSDGTLNVERAA